MRSSCPASTSSVCHVLLRTFFTIAKPELTTGVLLVVLIFFTVAANTQTPGEQSSTCLKPGVLI
jgi:hypothetical protein